ncbi:MAG: GvpL/GvpF family gas vesicle protein [Pirellulales bacterium]
MTGTTTASATALYLYGITLAGGGAAGGGAGVCETEVEPLVEGRLAAIVSRLADRKLRAQRSNLAAHHRVLRDLAERQPVLPAVFGTIAGGEEDLRGILRRNHDRLAARLNQLRDTVEMTLKVFWEPSNIFEYFVATHEELKAMRNRLFRPGRTPTLDEKIALGRLFESLLTKSRERHTRRVIDAMSPYSVETRSIDPGNERMIMKLACLVHRDMQRVWEEGVQEAAGLFDNNYRFDYSGPWPTYNFADIDLELE